MSSQWCSMVVQCCSMPSLENTVSLARHQLEVDLTSQLPRGGITEVAALGNFRVPHASESLAGVANALPLEFSIEIIEISLNNHFPSHYQTIKQAMNTCRNPSTVIAHASNNIEQLLGNHMKHII